MSEISMEEIITELVVNGGNARGKALEAIRAARKNDMARAKELLAECGEALTKAHNFQTAFIQETMCDENSAGGNASLIMVHGQDHLMDAMVVRDLAAEMVEMYKVIYEEKKKGVK